MLPIRPLPAAMVTTAGVAILLWLVRDMVPGEEIVKLLNQLLLALLGLSLLPPLAFGRVARKTAAHSIASIVALMAGTQATFLIPLSLIFPGVGRWLNNYFPGMYDEVDLGLLIVLFPLVVFVITPFSAWVALALTGNLRRVNVIVERE